MSREPAATGALWTLRVHCFRHCRLVDTHHNLEDIALVPRLRRVSPALGPVIDRLEADHAVVSQYLDEVEAAAGRLDIDDSARLALADALNGRARHSARISR